MFDGDKKLLQRMAPKLQRVLVADPLAAGVRVISDIMRDQFGSRIFHAETTERALKMAETCEPHIIFTEFASGTVNGLEFTRQLRRATHRMRGVPVIMATGEATATAILAARDAGVHEFLRKPFNMKDLTRRLEVVTLKDRDWVEALGYVGPDRRRFNSGEYRGPRKRKLDETTVTPQARIVQALKILRSAIAGAADDPDQALRAMLAQAALIQQAATELSDLQLTLSASGFYRQLTQAAHDRKLLAPAQLELWAAPLLKMLPREDAPRQAA